MAITREQTAQALLAHGYIFDKTSAGICLHNDADTRFIIYSDELFMSKSICPQAEGIDACMHVLYTLNASYKLAACKIEDGTLILPKPFKHSLTID